MFRYLCSLYLCIFFFPGLSVVFAQKKGAPSQDSDLATKAVEAAEEYRSAQNHLLKVELVNKDPSGNITYLMDVMRGESKRALVEFLSPKEEYGRRMLAVKNSYWATFPDSKKVHSISRKEMIGNSAFAIADLFQLDAKDDYAASILKREKCPDVKNCLVIELKAKQDTAPYELIHYTVEEDGFFPVKASFFGQNMKLIKSMEIKERALFASKVRPKVIWMKDELIKGRESTWITKSMKKQSFPSKVFTSNHLSGLL